MNDPEYEGSRNKRQRYTYNETSWSGFIELTPAFSVGPPADVIRNFRIALLEVPGVTQVALHPKGNKTQQGNFGSHYQHHNFVVTTRKTQRKWIEFELTRHNHMNAGPFTVSAMFKTPPHEFVPEAWRVLRAACQGKELLPNVAKQSNWNRCCAGAPPIAICKTRRGRPRWSQALLAPICSRRTRSRSPWSQALAPHQHFRNRTKRLFHQGLQVWREQIGCSQAEVGCSPRWSQALLAPICSRRERSRSPWSRALASHQHLRNRTKRLCHQRLPV